MYHYGALRTLLVLRLSAHLPSSQPSPYPSFPIDYFPTFQPLDLTTLPPFSLPTARPCRLSTLLPP